MLRNETYRELFSLIQRTKYQTSEVSVIMWLQKKYNHRRT